MWEMLLRLLGAVLLFVLITAGLWLLCRKKKPFGTGLSILIGVLFGACSVASTHFGQNQGLMVLNVRDLGPMAAGLFFSPLSGLIAGFIGGAERYLAGTLWNIGVFTTLPCALTTCFAGILAAALNQFAFKGRRPTVPHAYFLGALIEVFEMYNILLATRSNITIGYYVVRSSALPMILAVAGGLAVCSAIIRRISGEQADLGWGQAAEKVPLSSLFQRALLAVIVALFLVNYALTWQFLTNKVRDDAEFEISYLLGNAQLDYEEYRDKPDLIRTFEAQSNSGYVFLLTDGGKSSLTFAGSTESVVDPEDLAFLEEAPENQHFEHVFNSLGNYNMLCYRRSLGDGLFLTVMGDMDAIFQTRDNQMLESTFSDILLFTVIYGLVLLLVERLVIKNLQRVNTALSEITAGNLDQEVWVRSSSEFSALSDDINHTVQALRGYIDEAEKRMDDELKFAASIQESALPRNFQLPPEYIELYAMMVPAKQVGGDFYDFFFVRSDLLCLVIADVSGKGVPASLFMMRAKTSINYFARTGCGPGELLENVNNELCEDNDADMFVTVWLGLLDLNTGVMRCANAGHEYPALMRAGGNYELLKDKHATILAIFKGLRMKEYEITLNPGDRFFIYTDGVAEAMNEKQEQFGTDLMIERLNRRKPFDQKQMLEGMLQDIRNYAGTAEQFDDITMLSFTYKGGSPSRPQDQTLEEP